MSTITYSPTEYTPPNITVEGMYSDGVLAGYRLTADEGYVFYDTTLNDTGVNPTTYCYVRAYIPRNCNFSDFHYAAVPRSEVPENQIFGTDTTDDEEETDCEEIANP